MRQRSSCFVTQDKSFDLNDQRILEQLYSIVLVELCWWTISMLVVLKHCTKWVKRTKNVYYLKRNSSYFMGRMGTAYVYRGKWFQKPIEIILKWIIQKNVTLWRAFFQISIGMWCVHMYTYISVSFSTCVDNKNKNKWKALNKNSSLKCWKWQVLIIHMEITEKGLVWINN